MTRTSPFIAPRSAAGCTRIYEEKISGANRNRPELARLLDHLRGGDVVVVYRLDRLARSTRDLLDIAELIKEAEAGLRSLSEPWADTTSPAGRMVLTIFAGIAEFERALIHQRTGSGRAAARARGVRFGRPPKLTAEQVVVARRLIDEGTAVRETARILNVHAATLYRALGTMTASSARPVAEGPRMSRWEHDISARNDSRSVVSDGDRAFLHARRRRICRRPATAEGVEPAGARPSDRLPQDDRRDTQFG